jgi:hypothetical protein
MDKKPVRFKLQNGLAATVHPPKSALMKQLREDCLNKRQVDLESPSMYAVEIEIENERVYVLYAREFWWHPEEFPTVMAYIIMLLETRMEQMLRDNWFIIHANIAYPPNNATNETLVNGIINKVKPCLAPLVTEPKKERTA